jgi:hypothetical protein
MITKHDPALVKSIIASSQKVLLPMIRHVWPNTIAQQIIGCQPMTGPVGEIFTISAGYRPKSKYKFSRAKWYEADRAIDHSSPWLFMRYNREQFSWCVAQFGPAPDYPDAWSRWYMINDRFRFRDERDYILFTLRWS